MMQEKEVETLEGLRFSKARANMDFVIGAYLSLWLDASKRIRDGMPFHPTFSSNGLPHRLIDSDGSFVAEMEYKTGLFSVKWVRSVDDFLLIDRVTQDLEEAFYD